MRRAGIVCIALATCLAVQGCRTETGKQKAKEAVDAAGEVLRAERDAYQRILEKSLKELDARTADLRERAAKATGDLQKDLEKKLVDVNALRKVAAEQLEEVRTTGVERWQEVRDGASRAFDELRKSFE